MMRLILNVVTLLIFMSSFARAHTSCKIVTSFSILKDMVQNITGSACQVISIVGANADAHVFEPMPSTSKLILNADLIITNGLGFERWMDKLVLAARYAGPIESATTGIQPRILHTPSVNTNPVADPHAWLTLPNALKYVDRLQTVLCCHFPDKSDIFRQNTLIYKQKIEQLEENIRSKLAEIPPAQRRVITAHDAFGYTGQCYNIEFMAPLGMSTESEPSAKQMVKLIEQIRASKVRALFIENIVNRKIIDQIAEETGIAICGQLYSDALSLENEPAATYLDLMSHNMMQLIQAMKL